MTYSLDMKLESIQLHEKGYTVQQICEYLRKKHNTPFKHPTVSKWVKDNREKILAENALYSNLESACQSNVSQIPVRDTHTQPPVNVSGGSFFGARSVVMAIPDMHCPWEHPDALAFLKSVRAKYKPTTIVNLGDEVDFYGMSRFEHDVDVINAGAELSLAVKHLIPFYREFPNSLVCQSNHTHRVHAKAQKAGLPSSTIKSIEEILKTPEGWIYKQCHTVDGVDYKHGTGKSGAMAHLNHAKATGRSTCIGHIHAFAAVNYLRKGFFAANFGCLIDKHAPCFAYASDMDDNIVLGCGIVIDGKEAHFIPMHVDEQNRWIGHL